MEDEAPDIFVSTGDLLDGLMADPDGFAEMLAGIRPRFGKYAVMGNHEYYAGVELSLAFHERAGFRVLRDDTVSMRVAKGRGRPMALNMIGVDFHGRRGNGSPVESAGEDTLMARVDNARPTIVLKHMPTLHPAVQEGAALQLSGHTHNGQIFPFNLITRLVFPYITGDYPLTGGGLLHVSRGSGNWGPPVRVLSPPELTVIEFK